MNTSDFVKFCNMYIPKKNAKNRANSKQEKKVNVFGKGYHCFICKVPSTLHKNPKRFSLYGVVLQ